MSKKKTFENKDNLLLEYKQFDNFIKSSSVFMGSN